jgi:hypothetical protein
MSSTSAKGSTQTNKSPRKGSNKKSKRQPKGSPGLAHRTVRCATGQCPVHHRTVSGAPGNPTPNLPSLGIRGGRSAIIHRTVRCAKRSNGRLQRYSETLQCATARAEVRGGAEGAPDSEQDLSGGPVVRSSNGRNPTAW